MREITEHRRVVRRVADENEAAFFRIEVGFKTSAHERSCHRQFIVAAEPAVDVDRAHFRGHAGAAHERNNPGDGLGRQGRHVLAIIDREVGGAIMLIAGDRAAGDLRQNAVADLRIPFAIGGAGGGVIGVMTPHRTLDVIVAEIERAIFADHRIDRPHAGNVVAPARGTPGNWNDQQMGLLQCLERGVGGSGQPAVGRQCVVDIAQHAAQLRALRKRKLGERPHQ
jgi:hypothetical protein